MIKFVFLTKSSFLLKSFTETNNDIYLAAKTTINAFKPNKIATNITPIVFGNLKKSKLMYPKKADSRVRMVAIVKKSMLYS